MAKALLGHMGGHMGATDPRQSREALLMRRRIADLEALVSRLQRANDDLEAELRERDLLVPTELAPASPERLLEPVLH